MAGSRVRIETCYGVARSPPMTGIALSAPRSPALPDREHDAFCFTPLLLRPRRSSLASLHFALTHSELLFRRFYEFLCSMSFQRGKLIRDAFENLFEVRTSNKQDILSVSTGLTP